MSTYTTRDGTEIFYKDWGTGQPVVFSHGWPLSADAWDAQMVFLGERGNRVIAHDRRSHGRSSQTWNGNDMDTYADDLAGLIDALDLRDVVLVGHSTGGGEVARYIGRHGTGRVAKVVLLGRGSPADAPDAVESGWPAARRVRQDPRGRANEPFAVLPGPGDSLLRLQPRGRQGLPGRHRRVLAPGDARGREGRARLHQAVLRDGLHGGPEGVRRADAHRPRRRRSDRPDRDLGAPDRETRSRVRR